MRKNRPDLADTQEIVIPKDSIDYDDDYVVNVNENLNSDISNKKRCSNTKDDFFLKRNVIIFSCVVFLVFLIIVVFAIIFFNNSENMVNTNLNTNNTSFSIPTTVPTTKKINTVIESVTEDEYIAENTAESIEPTTIENTTGTKPEETTSSTVETEETSKTQETTSKDEKVFSVDNIMVLKNGNENYIVKILGSFSGYSPDELLAKVSVTTSSGIPSISNPNLEEDVFNFELVLNGCEGDLKIRADMFNYFNKVENL